MKHPDCIVIGGGMAGLSAAHALRSRHVLVLEESHRPGGRVHSLMAGDYWLNFGAHMFGGPETLLGALTTEFNLPSEPIRGRLMGMIYGGKRLLRHPPESYPFLLPFSLRERFAMLRMGLALRLGSSSYVTHMKGCDDATQLPQHALSFRNTRTLSQAIGQMPPRVAEFLTAITERNGGDPDDMAEGHALRSFTNVWSTHAPGRNIIGGSALLPQAMANALGDGIRYGHSVDRVTRDAQGVTVQYRHGTTHASVRARTAIIAVPAPVAARIMHDLPPATLNALRNVTYGPFLSASVLTRETTAMPWDGHYAIATPGRSFSVLFNMATTLRSGVRRPGGSLMLFRGARGAAALMEMTDAAIEQQFRRDLLDLFPEAKDILGDIVVQRWPLGAPFSRPGRAALQPGLTAPLEPAFLAGDYMEFPNMEAAVASGQAAARKALALLTAPGHKTPA
ncbi:MAG: NAD(P)/FAD-dependent oxidoreductase [Gemmobacter sp.]|nr:NAD(P)/FAD-dependent oxidoreductase [Gemmobacter sp.]